MRNAMLPQITRFAIGFAALFSGALITEVVFAYPGIGFLAYHAILSSDYNVLMGITTLSIIALTTSTLIMDLSTRCLTPGSGSLKDADEDTPSALRDRRFSYRREHHARADRAGPSLLLSPYDPTVWRLVPRDLPPVGWSICWGRAPWARMCSGC